MDKTISNNKGAISSEDVLKIGLNLQMISFAVDSATFDLIKPYLDTIVDVVKKYAEEG